jgi:hypothetical protein
LFLCTAILVFFLLAPSIGYPLEFSQSMRILEIVLPVFLGYLGTAALFVFRSSPTPEAAPPDNVVNLINVLVKGPIVVFGIVVGALVLAFGRLNSAEGAGGMSLDELAAGMSLVLGLLTVTTNVMVAYLFGGLPTGKEKEK